MHETDSQHEAHGNFRSYLIGFTLSILLTAVPFALVMGQMLPPDAAFAAIFALAVVQILVHLRYFLHIDTSRKQGDYSLSFAFTTLIVAILVGGSMWIMINIGHHMMGAGH